MHDPAARPQIQLSDVLQARPATVFWAAALAQALLWVVVPLLVYRSPPGLLAETLAIGREWQPGSWAGPPLSAWLADLAFRAAGQHLIGVYLLAQACVVGALWTVFRLGRALIGDAGALMGMLLSAGVLTLALPTPEFGPDVLAMPLVGLSLLFYWRAVGESRGVRAWLGFAASLGLLLLTSHWGLLFTALFAGFTLATPQGRGALRSFDPWAAFTLALLLPLPYAAWLGRDGHALLSGPAFAPLTWLLLVAGLALGHAGVAALIGADRLRGGATQTASPESLPVTAPSTFGHQFVFLFGAAPMLIGSLLAAVFGTTAEAGHVFGIALTWASPLTLLSGLAAVMLRPPPALRPRLAGAFWGALLLLPALALILSMAVLPWLRITPLGAEPADEIGRFFAETFQRRVGKPLEIVSGDLHLASLIAASTRERPRVYAPERPELTPWLSDAAARQRGTMLVWPITDSVGAPPPALAARFPGLVPEVPQTFARPVQGFLPSVRIGWALVRPAEP